MNKLETEDSFEEEKKEDKTEAVPEETDPNQLAIKECI